jgi:hypothetical protein
MRGFATWTLCAFALSHAPLQCSRSPEPDLAPEETPPEALYQLAQRFHDKGDERGRRETLRFLAERYPSSRFAIRAKDELAGDAGAGKIAP